MYEKVRVKKSQIYEENQDTSQKETKTEDMGRVSHLGAAQDPWAPPTTPKNGSGLFWLLLTCGLYPGLLGTDLHEFLADYLNLIFRLFTYTFLHFS